jgi:uridine kinase
MKRLIIGIAGGTGSGKTTVARSIIKELNEKDALIIGQDSYYLDRSDLTFEQREKINYDHPDAFDNKLLENHIHQLSQGLPVNRPVYCYKTHARLKETVLLHPAKIIILEGIMVLVDPKLRDLLDIKIFVDTDADVRFIRRVTRDIKERGRTMESVIDQYLDVVRLMNLEFVEPSKRFADIIVPEGGFNKVAIDIILAKIRAVLNGS